MIAVVFSVLLYRLAVAGAIYRIVSNINGGPSVGDILVSITGAMIQLIAIIVMNKVYEFLAYKLTNWGMYIFCISQYVFLLPILYYGYQWPL